MIDRKIKHRPATKAAVKPRETGGVIDLLAVLEESIRAGADKRRKPASGTRPKTTKALVKGKRASGLNLNL